MVVNSGQDLIRQPGRGSVLFTALLGLSLAVLRGAFLLKASLRYLLQRSFLHALSGPVPFLFGGGGLCGTVLWSRWVWVQGHSPRRESLLCLKSPSLLSLNFFICEMGPVITSPHLICFQGVCSIPLRAYAKVTAHFDSPHLPAPPPTSSFLFEVDKQEDWKCYLQEVRAGSWPPGPGPGCLGQLILLLGNKGGRNSGGLLGSGRKGRGGPQAFLMDAPALATPAG